MAKTLESLLFGARRAAVVAHVSPDGDAIGSVLAMRMALEARGVSAAALLPGKIGAEYGFLPKADEIIYPSEDFSDDFDLVVCVDCADETRLGAFAFLLSKKDRPVVVIDHHVTNRGFGDENLIEADSAATGEVLTRLFQRLNVPITPEMALCLYTAISTDTGGFAFSNTHEATLRAAADLVAFGADPALVYRRVYASRRIGKTRLIARALQSMKTACEDQVITGILTAKDFEECGADACDSEGIIDFLRDVDTCLACALLRDTKDGSKASLRCEDGYDVAAVAARFGGGGHKNAAGCSFDVPAKEAEAVLRKALCTIVLEKQNA